MAVESYEVRIHDCMYVFAASTDVQRLKLISSIMMKLGARSIGPSAWFIEDVKLLNLEEISRRLGSLLVDEAIYVTRMSNGNLRLDVLVESRNDEGIVVSSNK